MQAKIAHCFVILDTKTISVTHVDSKQVASEAKTNYTTVQAITHSAVLTSSSVSP